MDGYSEGDRERGRDKKKKAGGTDNTCISVLHSVWVFHGLVTHAVDNDDNRELYSS